MNLLNKKIWRSLLVLTVLVSLLMPLTQAMADDPPPRTLRELFFNKDLKAIGDVYGYPAEEPWSSPTYYVARVVRVVLTLMGTLFLLLLVYGGITWMTAGGNEEQVKKARGILQNAIVGILIVFGAYIITWFVVRELYQASTGVKVPYSTFTWPSGLGH